MSNSLDIKALFRDPEVISLFRGQSPAHSDIDADMEINAEDQVVMKIPYQARFSASKRSPALHPGVVMTAMDSAMGLATIINLDEFSSLATLELRYDQLRSIGAESSVRIVATFESVNEDLAYLTAQAEDENGVFARSTARFILTPASSGFIESALDQLADKESSS